MDQKSVRVIGQRSPLTVRLISVIENGKPGDEFTDEQLTKEIGLNTSVNGKGYGYLLSAISYCESHGVIWKRAPKQNKIVCMFPEEIIKRSVGDIKGIRKASRRSSRRLSTVNTDALPADKRSQAYIAASQLGAISIMSSSGTTRQLKNDSGSRPPSIDSVLKQFGNK